MKRNGYTFLELICLLVCLLILVGISSATWLHFHSQFQQHAIVERINQALMLTRAEAISKNQKVLYCGSSDKAHCDGQWQKGQIIKIAKTSQVLKTYPAINSKLQMKFIANFGKARDVMFTPMGFTNGQQGHFSFCILTRWNRVGECQWIMLHFSGQAIIKTHMTSG
jgi:type IV fimbrial biogenesis protein FimT